MKASALTVLLALTGLLSVAANGLTLANWDTETAGKKKVMVYFSEDSCGPCRELKPHWEKLKEHFENSNVGGVYDVDCSGDGQQLCIESGVQTYPTIKSGDPTADKLGLPIYEGIREFEQMRMFTEDQFDPCGPNDLDACTDEKRGELEAYLKMPIQKLLKEIKKTEKAISGTERKMSQGIAKWREMTQELEEDREEQKTLKPKKGKEKEFEAKEGKLTKRKEKLDKDHQGLLQDKLSFTLSKQQIQIIKSVIEKKKNEHAEL